AGLSRGKRFTSKQTLDNTLAEARDNELKIADHTAARLKGQNGVLAYSKNKEEDAEKFDAFEVNGNFSPFSMPFSPANYLTKLWGRKYEKPVLRNSDGHHPKDIGKTYNIFNSEIIDYSSERKFRDSINYHAREGNFEYQFKPIPIWRVFHHALMLGINYLFRKKDNK
ncbi:MAG TPA: PHP-associated domain-containing protein, partial [Patescibacteria group bacterium]|nr:PHP-associated domain-containing protein [Patescibacteria group bacterium]